MTREEIIERIRNNAENLVHAVSMIPDGVRVSFVNGTTAFIEKVETYRDFVEIISLFDEKELNYLCCYMALDNVLAIMYKYQSIDVVFYCGDVETALEELSGGACKVVEHTITETKKTLSCNI